MADLRRWTSGGAPTSSVSATQLRASDADRERVVAVLREAVAQGRLDLAEFEDRIARAYAAKTLGDLRPLTADLPVAPDEAIPLLDTGPILVIASHSRRRARWIVPPRLVVTALLGSVELDLCEAVLSRHQVRIELRVVAGRVEVVVPDSVRVRVRGTDLVSRRAWRARRDPGPDAPVVDIGGVVVLGHVRVRSPSRRRLRELGH